MQISSSFLSGQVQATFDPFDRHQGSVLYLSAISDLMSPDDYTEVYNVSKILDQMFAPT